MDIKILKKKENNIFLAIKKKELTSHKSTTHNERDRTLATKGPRNCSVVYLGP